MTTDELLRQIDDAVDSYDWSEDVVRETFANLCVAARAEIIRLRAFCDEHLSKSADGKFLVECDVLYCPHCGGKTEDKYHNQECWNCPNPDSFGEIPLPLLDSMCYADPKNIPAKGERA